MSTPRAGRGTVETKQLSVHPQTVGQTKEFLAVYLPEYDLWFTFIKNVHVVPALLDCDRFVRALKQTLDVYRHAAGRLCCDRGSWKIQLTDASVPLEVERRLDDLLHFQRSRWVIQDSLDSYLNLPPPGSIVVNRDAPLLRMKLTHADLKTVIGVSWHHTLGDATALLRFMQFLSQAYQGLPPVHPMPTFIKHIPAHPDQKLMETYTPLMPHLSQTYPFPEIGVLYAKMNQNLSRVDFRIGSAKLCRLRIRLMGALGPHLPDIRISLQDCLTAYIASVFGRCLDTPICTVTNAASYREISAPFIDGNVAGNEIYIIPCSLRREDKTLHGTAAALRMAIQDCRNISFVEEWVAVASQLMLAAANKNESLFFAAPPDSMSVNSNASLDWNSAHFGFPSQTRFHTSGINDRYVRVFRSNPGGREEGGCDADGSLDVCFAVAGHSKMRVVEMLSNEIQSPDFPDNLEM